MNDNVVNIEFSLKKKKNVFAQYPFLPIVLVLMFSIVIGYYSEVYIPWWGVFILLVLAIYITYFTSRKTLSKIFIYLLIFSLGIKSTNLALIPKQELPESKQVYIGIIDNTPRIKPKSIQVEVKLLGYIDSLKYYPLNTKIVVYFRTNEISRSLQYGDSVIFIAKVSEVKNAGNPYEFDYKGYLRRLGIYYSAFVDTGNYFILGHGGGNKILLLANRVRNRLIEVYRFNGISGTDLKLLSALTLGYRQALDKEIMQKFSKAGAMHILAVSGLHVGILYGVLILLFGRFLKTRYKYLILILILFVLWSFALITGFSPSVRRSAFMFSLITISQVTLRKTNIFNSLAASAFIMLMFFPLDLFSVGFWLSYFAVLSIVLLYPIINKMFILPFPFDKIWSLISVSIAAQIGTMPLGLYIFHQFPNYFILTNLFAVPLSAIILYLSLFLLSISFFTALASVVAKVLKFFVGILWWAIKTTESLPGSSFNNIYFTFNQMILFYIILISFFLLIVYAKRIYIFSLLLALFLFLGLNLWQKYKLSYHPLIIVYNVPGHTVLNFVSMKTNVLLIDSLITQEEWQNIVMPYWKYAHLPKPSILKLSQKMNYKNQELIIKEKTASFVNKRILFIDNDDIFYKYTSKDTLKVDYLIQTTHLYTDLNQICSFFNPKKIIFTSSCKPFYVRKREEQVKELNLMAYSVIGQGALIQKITEYD